MFRVKKFIQYTFIFYALTALVYWIFIRPVHISWGATAAELQIKFPADKLIFPNRIVSTLAITIKTPKEKIFVN